jgi:hypothetical protein
MDGQEGVTTGRCGLNGTTTNTYLVQHKMYPQNYITKKKLFSSCALVLPPPESGSQEIVATINFRESLQGPHKVSVLAIYYGG